MVKDVIDRKMFNLTLIMIFLYIFHSFQAYELTEKNKLLNMYVCNKITNLRLNVNLYIVKTLIFFKFIFILLDHLELKMV